MLTGQADCKVRLLRVLIVVFGLWVPVAIAAVNANLFEAVEYGDLPAVKRFIANGVDVNARRSDGTTALHVASYYGNKEVVELLLANGANVNVTDKNGATPLHAAAQEDHREVVEALLAKGADINSKRNNGLTALHISTEKGYKDIVEALLAKGADVNIKRLGTGSMADNGPTALYIASEKGYREIAEALLAKGANVNAAVWDGQTALYMASYYGHRDIVKLLLAKGADINARTTDGETALHVASRTGRKEIVELLLENGADANTKGGYGFTPLILASEHGHRDVVELLLAKGADVNARGDTNLITSLYKASSEGHRDVVKLLLEKGANVNEKIWDGETPLHAASRKGYLEVVEALLAKGADVNAKANNGETAFKLASREGRKDLVALLAGRAKSTRIEESSSSGMQGGHSDMVKPVSPQVPDNVATAERKSNSKPHDSVGVPYAGPKSTVVDINSPVEKGANITFRNLAESVFKGVHQELGSEKLVTDSQKVLRRPGTKERTVLPAGAKLNWFEAIRVRGDGRRYIVAFWTADDAVREDTPLERAAILAVFPEGSPEPGDVADVQTDMFCSISDAPLLSMGPDDAFTISNSHHNSSQGYLDTTLFHIHEGRLQRIAEVLTLRNNSACKDSFEERLTWRTEPDAGSPYPKVVATVKLTHGISEDDGGSCPKGKAGFRKEEFSAVRRWDKVKKIFVLEGKGFDALDRFNRKNF